MKKFERVTLQMLDEIISDDQLVVAVVTYDDGLQAIDLFPNSGKRYNGSSFMSPIFVSEDDLIFKDLRQDLERNLVLTKMLSTMNEEEYLDVLHSLQTAFIAVFERMMKNDSLRFINDDQTKRRRANT